MWFNQITCDNCFKILTTLGRHNKYYVAEVQDFQSRPRPQTQYVVGAMSREIRVGEKTYSYLTANLDSQKWLTFCCVDCAIIYAHEHNCLLFYFDEQQYSVAYVTPHQAEINTILGKPKAFSIPDESIAEWDWFCQFYDTKDISQYGVSDTFPAMSLTNVNLIQPTARTIKEVGMMVSDQAFMKSYYGYYSEELSQKNRNSFCNSPEKNLAEFNLKYGRRAQIDWHIVDKTNNFVGFIHLTKLSNFMQDEWVLEFGLLPQYESQGIMTQCVLAVLRWAKAEGCQDVYAISEIFNNGSHAIFQKLPYTVEQSVTQMSDQYAGFRRMHFYHIKL